MVVVAADGTTQARVGVADEASNAAGQGRSGSEGRQAGGSSEQASRPDGGQHVDIVGLTCRSDGWAEGK